MYGDMNMITQIIGYLAHPSLDFPYNLRAHKQIVIDEQVLSETFNLLRLNKVLFRVLNARDSHHFPAKSNIVTKLMDESVLFRDSYEHMQSVKRELLDVVAKFNERSIDSVFIKSLNALPLDSDNFDILIRQKDLSASIKVLRNCGFMEVTWVREPYKWLFRKAEGDRNYMAIHLHTAVAWGGIKFVDVEDLWKKHRKKEIDGVTLGLPSPEHHLLTTVAHAFFENRQFSLGDLAYIIEDIQDNNIDWNYIANWTIYNRWFDSFYGVMQLADHIYRAIFIDPLIPSKAYELIVRKVKINRRGIAEKLIDQFGEKSFLPMKVSTTTVGMQYIKKILTAPDISPSNKAEVISYLFHSFIKKRIPLSKRHPAFLVCFIGQDGTGKTTHSKYVWKELREMSENIRVKYIWSRGFGYSLQPFLLVAKWLLLGSRSPKISQRGYVSRRASLLKREPMRSLWACILIIDHLLHLARVRLALSLGYIVICDRWIIDTLIDVKNDLGKPLNRFLERKIEGLVPKPEMTFIMDAKTSELIKRRPEVNNDLLERKRYLYLEQSQRKGGKVINTHENFERNRKTILSTIIKSFLSQRK